MFDLRQHYPDEIHARYVSKYVVYTVCYMEVSNLRHSKYNLMGEKNQSL